MATYATYVSKPGVLFNLLREYKGNLAPCWLLETKKQFHRIMYHTISKLYDILQALYILFPAKPRHGRRGARADAPRKSQLY